MMRRIWLFLLVCVFNGALALIGSILGNFFGKTGLFAGAVLGGLIGVALAGLAARRLRLIDEGGYTRTVIGGSIGFAVACLIATSNLHTPIIPLLSEALVGLGAVIGGLMTNKGSNKSLTTPNE
jgi:hypothetical protein